MAQSLLLDRRLTIVSFLFPPCEQNVDERIQSSIAIKSHSFFSNVNFALLRQMKPPFVPKAASISNMAADKKTAEALKNLSLVSGGGNSEVGQPEDGDEDEIIRPSHISYVEGADYSSEQLVSMLKLHESQNNA